MGTLGWVISIVGTLGVTGFIALIFFAPLVAQAVARVALDILQRILSTRIGVGALVGIVCLIVGIFYGDHSGAARVQVEWDEAKIQYAEEMETLRTSTQGKAQTSVSEAQQNEQTQERTDEKGIETYAQTLPRSNADDCRIGDTDLRAAGRLQDDRPRRHWRPLRKNPG